MRENGNQRKSSTGNLPIHGLRSNKSANRGVAFHESSVEASNSS